MKDKTSTEPTHEQQIDAYIRDTLHELDTTYDREALALIYGSGVLMVDDGGIGEVVNRIHDEDRAISERIVAAQDRASQSPDEKTRRTAVLELETLAMTRENECVDVAYLLGIAVGRRLGPDALRDRPVGPRLRK